MVAKQSGNYTFSLKMIKKPKRKANPELISDLSWKEKCQVPYIDRMPDNGLVFRFFSFGRHDKIVIVI